MKLLYLTSIITPASDAQAIQVLAMAKAFSKRLGDNFLFISPQTKENQELKMSWHWQRLPVSVWLPRPLRYVLLMLLSLPLVKKQTPHAIYSRDIGVIFMYYLLGYKTVYEIHKPFETQIGKRLFNFLCGKIKLVAISQALKDGLTAEYHVPERRIFVAHDGVFLDDFTKLDAPTCREQLRIELKAAPDALVALYSSNLYPGKGLELVLEAARRLPDMIFALIGRKDATEVSASSFPGNVRYLGRKAPDEVPAYTKGADVLILPFTKALKTWHCHSALKMFEYMAAGVPIVSSNIGTINEIFNEQNAYLFDPESIDAFVRALKHVRDNPTQAQEKAKQAYRDVGHYDWHERAAAILDFLDRNTD